jgi:hypothetical protein
MRKAQDEERKRIRLEEFNAREKTERAPALYLSH